MSITQFLHDKTKPGVGVKSIIILQFENPTHIHTRTYKHKAIEASVSVPLSHLIIILNLLQAGKTNIRLNQGSSIRIVIVMLIVEA